MPVPVSTHTEVRPIITFVGNRPTTAEHIFNCSVHGEFRAHVSEWEYLRRIDPEMTPACPTCASAALSTVVDKKLKSLVDDGRQLLTKAPE